MYITPGAITTIYARAATGRRRMLGWWILKLKN